MYELIGVDQKIYENFLKELYRIWTTSKNPYSHIFFAIKTAFKALVPQASDADISVFLRKLLKPLYDLLHSSYKRRLFNDEVEMQELYNSLYGSIQDEIACYPIEIKNKINKLFDLFYELKEHSGVIEIKGRKFITTQFDIITIANLHRIEYDTLSLLKSSKTFAKNISISTNTNKAPSDRTKFLNNLIELSTLNPLINKDVKEDRLLIINFFKENPRITSRFLSQLRNINFEIKSSFTRTIDELSPYLDADIEIQKKHIIISYIAYVFSLYNITSTKIPKTKILPFANESAKLVFPEFEHHIDSIVTEEKIRQPIRERAISHDLRLLEFTDNRLKIIRSEEEINISNTYLRIVTDTLRKS